MRAIDIETSVEVEGSRAEVRRRLSEAVDELTHPAPGQVRDVVVLGSTTDSIRVRVDGEGVRGTLECVLRPGLGVQGTAIDVRAHAEELPTAGRLLASVPGGRALLRRMLDGIVSDLFSEQPDEEPVPPGAMAHNPTRPAIHEPGVAAILRRTTVALVMGAAGAAVLLATSVVCFRIMDALGNELERNGERLPAVITDVGEEGDDDEFWVTAEAVAPGSDLEVHTYAEQAYRPGQDVVILHDPDTGRSTLEGESYVNELLDTVGGLSAIGAALTVVLVGWYSASRVATGRILRSTPFEVAEVSEVLAMLHRGTVLLRLGRSDGSGHDVVRTTRQMTRRFERVVEALPPRCLVARRGRRAVLWRADLDRLVVVHTSRFALRNERWERAAGVR